MNVNKAAYFILLVVTVFAVLEHHDIQKQQEALIDLDIEHRQLEIRYLERQLELIDESAVLTSE